MEIEIPVGALVRAEWMEYEKTNTKELEEVVAHLESQIKKGEEFDANASQWRLAPGVALPHLSPCPSVPTSPEQHGLARPTPSTCQSR